MFQKLTCLVIVGIAFNLGACMSSGVQTGEADYVRAQIYQRPGISDGRFGNDVLPGAIGGLR